MALYGTIKGQFLAQDGERTPLTGRIIFRPKKIFAEAGIDYPATPVTGYLNGAGELTTAEGEPLMLLYGQWQATFLLRYNGQHIPILPRDFTVEGDLWVTHSPGDGWNFQIVPNGDGTARLIAPEITMNNDGTATVRIA